MTLESQTLSSDNKLGTNFEKHKLETVGIVETHHSANRRVNNNSVAEDPMDWEKTRPNKAVSLHIDLGTTNGTNEIGTL